MNITAADHAWANSASLCARQRYFTLCDAPTQTHEALNPAYSTWQVLADMAMGYQTGKPRSYQCS